MKRDGMLGCSAGLLKHIGSRLKVFKSCVYCWKIWHYKCEGYGLSSSSQPPEKIEIPGIAFVSHIPSRLLGKGLQPMHQCSSVSYWVTGTLHLCLPSEMGFFKVSWPQRAVRATFNLTVTLTQVFVLPLQLLIDETLLFQLLFQLLYLLLHGYSGRENQIKTGCIGTGVINRIAVAQSRGYANLGGAVSLLSYWRCAHVKTPDITFELCALMSFSQGPDLSCCGFPQQEPRWIMHTNDG